MKYLGFRPQAAEKYLGLLLVALAMVLASCGVLDAITDGTVSSPFVPGNGDCEAIVPPISCLCSGATCQCSDDDGAQCACNAADTNCRTSYTVNVAVPADLVDVLGSDSVDVHCEADATATCDCNAQGCFCGLSIARDDDCTIRVESTEGNVASCDIDEAGQLCRCQITSDTPCACDIGECTDTVVNPPTP